MIVSQTFAAIDHAPIVEVVKSPDQLQELSSFWRDCQWHPSHDYDDVLAAMEQPGDRGTPVVLAVKLAGDPINALVGWQKPETPPWKLGYTYLTRQRFPCLTFPFGSLLDPNPAPNTSSALIATVEEYLSNGHADFALLQYLDTSSTVYQQAKTSPELQCRDLLSDPVPHYTLDLNRTFTEYLASLSKNTRSHIRRCRKKIEKAYGEAIEVRAYTKTEHVDEAASAVAEIEPSTWQYSALGQVLTTADQIYHWRQDAAKGRFLTHVLFINGKPVAYELGMVYKGRYDAFYAGYDPEYSKNSPGMYLMAEITEKLCSDPDVNLMDVGFSVEQYKRRYCEYSTDRDTVALFAPSVRGLCVWSIRLLAGGGNLAIKRALSRLGAFDKARKSLHQKRG